MTIEGIYQVFLRDEDRRKENELSTQRQNLRDEMGEELYMQYFPNEVAEDAEALEEAKKSLEKIKGMRQPSWKKKKADTTDWNI